MRCIHNAAPTHVAIAGAAPPNCQLPFGGTVHSREFTVIETL